MSLGVILIVARNLSGPARLERLVHGKAQRERERYGKSTNSMLWQGAGPPDGRGTKGGVAHFAPHVMCHAPYLTNAAIGSSPNTGPAFVATEGTPQALIIVPVGGGHEHE